LKNTSNSKSKITGKKKSNALTIQKLLQETHKEAVNEKEEMVMWLLWQFQNFHGHFSALMEEREDPGTGSQFRQNGYKWRAILTKDLYLFLQRYLSNYSGVKVSRPYEIVVCVSFIIFHHTYFVIFVTSICLLFLVMIPIK